MNEEKMESPVAHRLVWLDALKGFAIICVVAGHISGSLFKSGMYSDHSLETIEPIVNIFHMKLFFILSGFSFGIAYIDADGELSMKKAKRQTLNIVLLYFIYNTLRFCFKIVFSKNVNSEIDLSWLLLSWYKAIDEYWYLYTLALIYLTIVILWRIKDKVNNTIILVVTACISLITESLCLTTSWDGSRIFVYIFYFLIGLLTANTSCKSCLWVRIVEFSIGIIGITLTIFSYDIPKWLIYTTGFLIADSVFGLVYIYRDIITDKSFLKPLSYIGSHCLEIYLLHVYFTSGLRPVISRCDISSWCYAYILILFFGIIGPITISWIINRIGLWEYAFKPVNILASLNQRKTR